jgi:hypothetical protein
MGMDETQSGKYSPPLKEQEGPLRQEIVGETFA